MEQSLQDLNYIAKTANTSDDTANIDLEYRNIVQGLLAAHNEYESALPMTEETFNQQLSTLQLSHKHRIGTLEDAFSGKRFTLFHTLEEKLKDLERQRNGDMSKIQSNSSSLRHEAQEIVVNCNGVMILATLALDKVNLRHLIPSKNSQSGLYAAGIPTQCHRTFNPAPNVFGENSSILELKHMESQIRVDALDVHQAVQELIVHRKRVRKTILFLLFLFAASSVSYISMLLFSLV